ncbi:MAG: DUF1269 domain-containing protein [Pyrinomonadaceae bacterium]
MDNIIVATFDNEKTAVEGVLKLNALDHSGEIATYNNVLIRRNQDGSFDYLKDTRDFTVWNSMGGMLLGATVGIIGGPVGALAGLFAGLTVGGVADLAQYSFDYDFLENFKDGLPKGTTSLIAQISEPNESLINDALQPLGAQIWRSNVYAQQDRYVQSQVDALDAGILEAEKELEEAAADEKTKVQAKLTDLRAKRDAKVAEIKAEFQEDVDEMNAQIDRFKQTLQGKVDETRRKVLERRLAYNESKVKKYEAQAEKLNAEIAKTSHAAPA